MDLKSKKNWLQCRKTMGLVPWGPFCHGSCLRNWYLILRLSISQSLEPIYKQLGEKFKKLSPDVVIAKMDATANDKMPGYEVSGFPTIYFAPKNAKDKVRHGVQGVKDSTRCFLPFSDLFDQRLFICNWKRSYCRTLKARFAEAIGLLAHWFLHLGFSLGVYMYLHH